MFRLADQVGERHFHVAVVLLAWSLLNKARGRSLVAHNRRVGDCGYSSLDYTRRLHRYLELQKAVKQHCEAVRKTVLIEDCEPGEAGVVVVVSCGRLCSRFRGDYVKRLPNWTNCVVVLVECSKQLMCSRIVILLFKRASTSLTY